MIMDTRPAVIKAKEGWASLQKDITKVKNVLEGGPMLTADEYMSIYTDVYNMTKGVDSRGGRYLLDKYRGIHEDYISTTIIPALREQRDESMLRELVKRWNQHKINVRLLSNLFSPIQVIFYRARLGRTLSEVGILCFRDDVFAEVKNDVKDAVITLIDRERDGERIDQSLVKHVVGFFVEMGNGKMDSYEGDFETAMLADTAAYYSRAAAFWIQQDSYSEYTLKAEACQKGEKERAELYLHASTEPKLLEIVKYELVTKNEAQLLAKQMSGCNAAL